MVTFVLTSDRMLFNVTEASMLKKMQIGLICTDEMLLLYKGNINWNRENIIPTQYNKNSITMVNALNGNGKRCFFTGQLQLD